MRNIKHELKHSTMSHKCATYFSARIIEAANLELVDKFCYLGDMVNVEGDADAVVEARIRVDGINSGSW